MQDTLIRVGDGYCIVDGPYPDTLLKKLKYWRRSLEWDEHLFRRVATGRYEELYTSQPYLDDKQQYCPKLMTMPGFAYKIKQCMTEARMPFKMIDERTPMPKPNIEKALTGLRDYQLEPIYKCIMSGGGIFSAPTGWGKGRVFASIAKAFDPLDLKARNTPLTVIATASKDITAKNFKEMKELLPDREIGLVMTGYKEFSDDIQVITLDSLHLLNPDEVGILIVDEVHVAASDSRSENLLTMRRAARWGVSATPTGRFDGKDLVTEGILGPVIHESTYGDAVKAGALVPITVYWITCPEPPMGIDKYLSYSSRAGKYRWGVYRNQARNQLIADLLRRFPQDMQCLAIMQFLEQMEYIKQCCDENVEIVHAETDEKKICDHKHLRAISPRERKEIYSRMETAEIKRILSTHVYSTGVNFPQLEVVINAGGGGSDIVSKQIPGRESRKTADKSRSYLIDFWHPWDQERNKETGRLRNGPIHADDNAREKVYTELEFEQVWIQQIDQIPLIRNSLP